MSQDSNSSCPVCRTAEIVCGKWTLLVIRDLAEGSSRFCELERSLQGISPRTLSLRLRALEEEGIVERHTYPEVPPRVEYALTEKGEALVPSDRRHASLRKPLARQRGRCASLVTDYAPPRRRLPTDSAEAQQKTARWKPLSTSCADDVVGLDENAVGAFCPADDGHEARASCNVSAPEADRGLVRALVTSRLEVTTV